MKNHNCKVRTFVRDLMLAQNTTYDQKNQSSIQCYEDGANKNLFFIYCRCHLINLVIEKLFKKSPLMRKAK